MPQRHKRKHDHHAADRPTRASKWDINVPHDPAIKATVPSTPEGGGGVVVAHAPQHVFWWVDAVEEGPETEEAPWD